jgi:hypothetical protein
MAKKDVYPGARCRIIGSAVGPKGTSVGRVCIARGPAQSLYGYPHSLWGQFWECESADGKPFDIKHDDGRVDRRMVAAFAEDWLEVIEDDEDLPKAKAKEHELVD